MPAAQDVRKSYSLLLEQKQKHRKLTNKYSKRLEAATANTFPNIWVGEPITFSNNSVELNQILFNNKTDL